MRAPPCPQNLLAAPLVKQRETIYVLKYISCKSAHFAIGCRENVMLQSKFAAILYNVLEAGAGETTNMKGDSATEAR